LKKVKVKMERVNGFESDDKTFSYDTSSHQEEVGANKICIECKRSEYSEQNKAGVKFTKGRSQCNSCKNKLQRLRKKRQREEEEAANPGIILTQQCTVCTKVLPKATNFDLTRGACRKCHVKSTLKSSEKKSINCITIAGRKHKGEVPIECVKCHTKFCENPKKFVYRPEGPNYRSICTKCFNINQNYKKSREKKKSVDLEGFLEHNAQLQQRYRDTNPEYVKAMNNKRKTSKQITDNITF
jgi:hypothetical protein